MLERPISPTWLRIAGLVGLALLLSVFAYWPLLAAYPHTQAYDGPFIQEMLESARVSMARYHELPLWNPYQCGGVPLWDNPQGMGTAPLFWPLVALSDTTRAVELWYILHAAAGFVSMWILARRELGLSRGASAVSSAMWAFCGAHNQHCCGGGFNWVPFFFIPLFLFLWRRAEKDARMAVGLGILGALTIYGGGAYPLPFVGLILAAETLTRIWQPRRIPGVLRAAGIVILVAFALSASRLIPVIYQLRSHTRTIGPDTDAMQWSTLKEIFIARNHGRGVPGQQYVWPEFCDYVGPFLLTLSFVGLALSGWERAWLIPPFVWAFLLMLGHQGPWAPWSILKAHVYPFKEMRVPSRFNVSVTLFLASFAGIAIDRGAELARRLSRSHRIGDAARTGLLVVGLIGAGDVLGTGIDWAAQCFGNAPLTRDIPVSPNLYLEGPGLAQFIDQPQQNRARSGCWEEWAFEVGAALWPGDVPQARAANDGAMVGTVKRTQNTFTAEVNATRPTRILFNSSYDRGWRTTVGTVVDNDKLLAVEVPAGTHRFVVKYWPRGLTVGFVISGLTVVGIVAFFVLDARKRRRKEAA